jgi:excisionase family DNA binding protein
MNVTVGVLLNGVRVPVELDDDAVATIAAAVAPTNEPWPEWMTISTASRYLDCTPGRLRKLKERGRIPFSQEGRGSRVLFERAELDRWLREQAGRRQA